MKSPNINISPFGQLEFRNREWFGLVNHLAPQHTVELTIAADNPQEDISEQIALIRQLAVDYDAIMAGLYEWAYENFQNTPYPLPLDEIKQMYFLAAVDLKADKKTWWLVLEPNPHVPSIYSHFLRFTMVERIIIWSNL